MKPRGRPKSEAKKAQIHRAAVELFIQHGYAGTSMDGVAQAANVSKQTVYSHFDSKDDLFTAAVLELCGAMGLPADLDFEERPLGVLLGEIGRRFLALLVSDEAIRLYRLVVGHAEKHPEVGRTFYETGPRTFIGLMAALLERRAARGEIEIEEAQIAAAQFFAMLRGELHMRMALGVQKRVTRPALDRYVDDCVRVFMRGHGG